MNDLTVDDLYDIYEDAGLDHDSIMEAIAGYDALDEADRRELEVDTEDHGVEV
jgi:hypothetical protein